MRLVIGLIGEQGAGKETVGNILMEFAPRINANPASFPGYCSTAVRHRFSDVLRETLGIWGVAATRENLQDLAVIMRDRFGKDALTNAMKHRAVTAQEDIVILDGVRWQADFDMIRSIPKHLLIYVTAKQQTRYVRALVRKGAGAKAGEQLITFEEFCAAEQKQNEILIPALGKQADVVIENNIDDMGNPNNPEALRKKVNDIFWGEVRNRLVSQSPF